MVAGELAESLAHRACRTGQPPRGACAAPAPARVRGHSSLRRWRARLPSILPSRDNLHLGATMTCPPKTFVTALPGHPNTSSHIEPHNERGCVSLLCRPEAASRVWSHTLSSTASCADGGHVRDALFKCHVSPQRSSVGPMHVTFPQQEATFERLFLEL